MQIVVTIAPGCVADPRKVAFWCLACDQQATEFAQAWGIEPTPVNFYSADVLAKMDDATMQKFVADSRLLTIQDVLDAPGALGYHTDVAGVIFACVLYQGDATSITISHEVMEEIGDPTCDVYIPMGDGRSQAKESADRVEGDSYTETATIGPDSVPVDVSNYLLPSAFVPGSSAPWDRMGRLTTWDGATPGGYTIIVDANGTETNVFARVKVGGPEAHATLAAKLERPDGRLLRRLRGAWAP